MQSQKESELPPSSRRSRFVVIGGGIAGLAAAYELLSLAKTVAQQPEIILLEGSPRLGGCISTYTIDDLILELGPDSFITEKPAALELAKRLGIDHRLITTDENHRRTFVAFKNRLHPLPEGFLMMAPTEMGPLLASPLFSWPAKLRMMQEMFVPPASAEVDESLAQFVERRLGREVLDRVVQPLVGGIYTGDAEKLSVRATLPRMIQLEQHYGSLIKGLTATRKARNESGARYGLFVTFDKGMSVLVNALHAALPPNSVRTHTLVSRVRRGEKTRWQLQLSDGSFLDADGIVIATSAYHAGDMLSDLDAGLSDSLRRIEYSSSAVLNVIYRRSDIPHPMDGFGFVVPKTENRAILACSFTSVKWPGRAPSDKALLRVFVGGALQPDIYNLSDEQIECLMWEDMHTYMGIKAVPLLSVVSRYPHSMPQYNVGHINRITAIEKSLSKQRGIALAGNAYHGVGIPDCVASGQTGATRVFEETYASKRAMPGG